jgi:hypothetical protein
MMLRREDPLIFHAGDVAAVELESFLRKQVVSRASVARHAPLRPWLEQGHDRSRQHDVDKSQEIKQAHTFEGDA